MKATNTTNPVLMFTPEWDALTEAEQSEMQRQWEREGEATLPSTEDDDGDEDNRYANDRPRWN